MLNTGRRKPDLTLITAFALSALLLVVNFIRILKVPITIDETGYDPADTWYDLVWMTNGSPNNHILHSLIRKFLVEHFSKDLFFYRVDSLVAQVLFLLFSFRLCRLLFKNNLWALLSFALLNVTCPLIFSFWGLSRGYSLALMFMTVSLYYYLRYMADNTSRLLYLSVVGAMLAAYSNFGYLNYFMTLSALIILREILFRNDGWQKRLLRGSLTVVISGALLAAVVVAPFRNIYNNGQNAYMGANGFVADTVTSLIRDGFYLTHPDFAGLVNILAWFVVALAIASGIFWAHTYIKGHHYKYSADLQTRWGIVLYLLFMIPAISLIAQHVFFNINYLTDRTALFFVISYTVHLIYLLYYIKPKRPAISWSALTVVFILMSYNFVSGTDLRSTHMWWFDADDLIVLSNIANEPAPSKRKIKIGTNWMVAPSFYYDTERYYPGKFEPIAEIRGNAGLDTTIDYFYITSSEVTDTLLTNYQRIGSYVGGGFALFKKK